MTHRSDDLSRSGSVSGDPPQLAEQPAAQSEATSDRASAERSQRVGYGRPPVHTRFKPGESGNRRGRPKGSKSIESICRSLLSRKVTVQDGNGRRSVPVLEAILLASSQRAIRGDNRAAKLIIELGQRAAEATASEEPGATPAQDKALVAAYLARMMSPAEPMTSPTSHADEEGNGDADDRCADDR